MEHFFNEGFGWTCRRCHRETNARKSHTDSRARFFTEGEAGDRASQLSAPALARWRVHQYEESLGLATMFGDR